MKANEEDVLARKLAGALDFGAAKLKQGTAYRLQTAREEALARLAGVETSAAPELALAGNQGLTLGGRRPLLSLRFWLPLLVVVAAIASYQSYQYWSNQSLRDVEDTDAGILTSDLPIDAYLDHGFNNWLKHSDE